MRTLGCAASFRLRLSRFPRQGRCLKRAAPLTQMTILHMVAAGSRLSLSLSVAAVKESPSCCPGGTKSSSGLTTPGWERQTGQGNCHTGLPDVCE